MEPGDLAELTRWLKQLGGAGIAILPLVFLVTLIQIKNQIGNGISKLVGGASKSAGGFGEKFGKKIDAGRELNSLTGRGIYGKTPMGGYRRYKNREENKMAGRESEIKRARAGYHADLIQSDEKYRNAVAGGTLGSAADPAALNRALANAINVKAQIDADEVKAATAIIKNADLPLDKVRELAKGHAAGGLDGSDLAIRRAAMHQVVKANDIEGIATLTDESRSWSHANDQNATAQQREDGSKLRAAFSEALGDSSYRPAWLSKGVIAGIENGDNATGKPNSKSTTELIQQAVLNNTYSPSVIAKADKDELRDVGDVMRQMMAAPGQLDAASAQSLAATIDNASRALADPRLSADVGKNLESVQKIANIR